MAMMKPKKQQPANKNEVGGGARVGSIGTGGAGRATVKGDGTSAGRGRLGVSTRGTELDSATKRAVTKQNKAANSYTIKDLDKMEKGQKYRAEQKIKKAAEVKATAVKNQVKGAAKAVGAIALTAAAIDSKKKAEAKPKPTIKPGSKKLTKDEAKLAQAVQKIGAIDKKPKAKGAK